MTLASVRSYKHTPRYALKSNDCQTSLTCAKKCLNKLKKKWQDLSLCSWLPFSPGEMVTSEASYYLTEACGAAPDSTADYGNERHFPQLQVVTAVGSDGQKCNPVSLETGERSFGCSGSISN